MSVGSVPRTPKPLVNDWRLFSCSRYYLLFPLTIATRFSQRIKKAVLRRQLVGVLVRSFARTNFVLSSNTNDICVYDPPKNKNFGNLEFTSNHYACKLSKPYPCSTVSLCGSVRPLHLATGQSHHSSSVLRLAAFSLAS